MADGLIWLLGDSFVQYTSLLLLPMIAMRTSIANVHLGYSGNIHSKEIDRNILLRDTSLYHSVSILKLNFQIKYFYIFECKIWNLSFCPCYEFAIQLCLPSWLCISISHTLQLFCICWCECLFIQWQQSLIQRYHIKFGEICKVAAVVVERSNCMAKCHHLSIDSFLW